MFQLDNQRKLKDENPSDLPSAKYKTLENYRVYGIMFVQFILHMFLTLFLNFII